MINIKAFLNLNYYTSELDEFLVEYDKNHKRLSFSQRQEIEKYQRIYKLRDIPSPVEPGHSFWEGF